MRSQRKSRKRIIRRISPSSSSHRSSLSDQGIICIQWRTEVEGYPVCSPAKKRFASNLLAMAIKCEAKAIKKALQGRGARKHPQCDWLHFINSEYIVEQEELECDVSEYRKSKHYGPELEQRTCIWAGAQLSWTEKSSGIPWIGVNGTLSTCVVAMNRKTSIRPSGRRQLRTDDLLCSVLADMGVWANITTVSTKFRREMRDQGYKEGPFAVVSVAPDAAVEDHFLNISQKCEEDAINFLKQNLEDLPSLTFERTKQIAVCALKCLLGAEFKSDKIELYSTGNWEGGNGIMSAAEVDEILASSYS